MSLSFLIIAVVTLGSAVAAMSLRNLVHCALCLIGTFVGLAALYLQLNAQFVGFAQVLVYIGAVAILIVFAILLTRGSETPGSSPPVGKDWWVGVAIACGTFGCLAAAVWSSSVRQRAPSPPRGTSVEEIGTILMVDFVLPLEVLGLLLTAALIGAVVIAMQDKRKDSDESSGPAPRPEGSRSSPGT